MGRKSSRGKRRERWRPFAAQGEHKAAPVGAWASLAHKEPVGILVRVSLAALVLFLSLADFSPAQTSNSSSSQTKQLYEEGLTALKSNDYAGAKRAFEGVLKNNPNDALAHNLLGWVLMTQGETKLAVQHLRTAIRLKPGMMEAHLTLSGALLQEKDAKGAEKEAEAAIRLAPAPGSACGIRAGACAGIRGRGRQGKSGD